MSALGVTQTLLAGVMAAAGSRFHSVAMDDFRSFFAGLEPVWPGYTCAQRWCSRVAEPPARTDAYLLCGAARKP